MYTIINSNLQIIQTMIEPYSTFQVVDYTTAREYSDRLGIPYLETSAKNNTNVEQVFMTMTAEIKNRIGTPASGNTDKNIKIDFNRMNSKEIKNSWSCCGGSNYT